MIKKLIYCFLILTFLFNLNQYHKDYLYNFIGSQVYSATSQKSWGTFFRLRISPTETILVGNSHVCQDSILMVITQLDIIVPVIYNSPELDLCFLKDWREDTASGLVLHFLDPEPNQNLSIIGYPGTSYKKTLTQGQFISTTPDGSYTTAKMFPGNSGSPVVNDLGLVVGVANLYNRITLDSYFIPIEKIKKGIENYKMNKVKN